MEDNNSIVPGFDNDESIEEATILFNLKKLPNVSNGILIILSGFIDTYNSTYFQKQISKAIASGYKNIILDCSNLTSIASTGFGVLTNILKMVNTIDGDMVLASVPANIMETFELLGFVRFFKIMNTLEEAYACFISNTNIQTVMGVPVFPKIIKCPVCQKALKASRAGQFRCSGCKSIINIAENGSVTKQGF